ncbi:MAG: N-carbamoylputrescine amidase [Candidatus Dadabacteria bacterium]|nr:MAG: N-carbamoylputrescine amidase [Candidatus Dadabacteria bacterium]
MTGPSGTVSVAVVQAFLGADYETNVTKIEELVFDACNQGATIVVLPELFEGPYFCRTQDEAAFDLARPLEGHPTVERFRQLAAELEVVLPVSFFERAGQACYNSVAVIDASGAVLGVYRKSHIPDGPGYQEKFYFRPGDTGFRVWRTREGDLGVGICWDQWFPEAARAMVLSGAELLVYPSAIGSEPADPELDTRGPWQRVMIGHAVANAVPVAAANRTGTEGDVHFYGHSFIANERGDIVAQLGDGEEGAAVATFDLARVRRYRDSFGFFRDRRPELYGPLVEPGSC